MDTEWTGAHIVWMKDERPLDTALANVREALRRDFDAAGYAAEEITNEFLEEWVPLGLEVAIKQSEVAQRRYIDRAADAPSAAQAKLLNLARHKELEIKRYETLLTRYP